MNDKFLRQDVIDEFEFDPSFDGVHIGVAVDRGVVTLSGYVESYAQKLAAVAAARRVKGVHAIADEIEIRYPFQSKTEDDQIAKRALDILKWNSTVSPYQIDVLVEAGWITLSGEVNWQFEKRAAEDSVRKLSGIVGVTNKMTLKPRVVAADVKANIEAALKRQAELDAGAIRVSVTGGDHVVLEGRVHSWTERSAAEDAAWSAPGVMSVDDLITLR
ncbi:MAG TPA: BON domain-containing protein [Bradyrhizobium sp.]|uniref:BON domain-containing protein n=1 Tax=Bradyrhizobium sp. TaxID=376 RepID=UPI002BF72A91|nr:BON domain-containing protein [Bradyrhizobium sp.]HLZ01121.1 BON domain-containing protein [Bradyrhizobium sp.]